LRGTKHQVALERRVFVARGRSDGRSVVIVPELRDNVTTGLTLLQVRFSDRLSAGAARGVLQGYRNRYSALRDAVVETEDTFREDLLGEQDVADLLTLPINDLADRWRLS
jgi:glucosamine--fructose-6-phosphate aminotransferase (isomerizing)